MAECASLCEHLHLPLQSGSDRTLARMHRGYTAERYLERLAAARTAIADLAVTTDIIVGFPGETEADFARTLEVVAVADYDAAYTFVFSPRPGTEAASFVDDFVPAEVIHERMERLTEVVEGSALRRHEARLGVVEEVLLDGPSKKDAAVWSGRSRHNKLVHVAPPAGATFAAGEFVTARVTHAAPHWLRGDFVDRVRAPRRRRIRIPVSASPA
jgi:tRNA-2-methylthio-N6-dimethylallyladenosine synthase